MYEKCQNKCAKGEINTCSGNLSFAPFYFEICQSIEYKFP